MQKKDYETFVKGKFKGKTKNLMLSQIKNFYEIAEQSFKNKKYKLGDDAISLIQINRQYFVSFWI